MNDDKDTAEALISALLSWERASGSLSAEELTLFKYAFGCGAIYANRRATLFVSELMKEER
jgi:hypothetical protein